MEFSINKEPEVIRHIIEDDGVFPNSALFILIYKKALLLPDKHAAQIVEDVFKWIDSDAEQLRKIFKQRCFIKT